eukprot:Rhum_TRINITY_DN15295_c19_g1::Rhum_TRINITY_DN15295_c19_g1_i1::g.149494::m.149494
MQPKERTNKHPSPFLLSTSVVSTRHALLPLRTLRGRDGHRGGCRRRRRCPEGSVCRRRPQEAARLQVRRGGDRHGRQVHRRHVRGECLVRDGRQLWGRLAGAAGGPRFPFAGGHRIGLVGPGVEVVHRHVDGVTLVGKLSHAVVGYVEENADLWQQLRKIRIQALTHFLLRGNQDRDVGPMDVEDNLFQPHVHLMVRLAARIAVGVGIALQVLEEGGMLALHLLVREIPVVPSVDPAQRLVVAHEEPAVLGKVADGGVRGRVRRRPNAQTLTLVEAVAEPAQRGSEARILAATDQVHGAHGGLEVEEEVQELGRKVSGDVVDLDVPAAGPDRVAQLHPRPGLVVLLRQRLVHLLVLRDPRREVADDVRRLFAAVVLVAHLRAEDVAVDDDHVRAHRLDEDDPVLRQQPARGELLDKFRPPLNRAVRRVEDGHAAGVRRQKPDQVGRRNLGQLLALRRRIRVVRVEIRGHLVACPPGQVPPVLPHVEDAAPGPLPVQPSAQPPRNVRLAATGQTHHHQHKSHLLRREIVRARACVRPRRLAPRRSFVPMGFLRPPVAVRHHAVPRLRLVDRAVQRRFKVVQELRLHVPHVAHHARRHLLQRALSLAQRRQAAVGQEALDAVPPETVLDALHDVARSPPRAVRGVGPCTRLQQQLHHLTLPAPHRHVQRRLPRAVLLRETPAAATHQVRHTLDVAVLRTQAQRLNEAVVRLRLRLHHAGSPPQLAQQKLCHFLRT